MIMIIEITALEYERNMNKMDKITTQMFIIKGMRKYLQSEDLLP